MYHLPARDYSGQLILIMEKLCCRIGVMSAHLQLQLMIVVKIHFHSALMKPANFMCRLPTENKLNLIRQGLNYEDKWIDWIGVMIVLH